MSKRTKSVAPKVRILNYKHAVEVSSLDGRQVSVIRGTHSLNTWTNKSTNGVTVRVDHSQTLRFPDSKVTARS